MDSRTRQGAGVPGPRGAAGSRYPYPGDLRRGQKRACASSGVGGFLFGFSVRIPPSPVVGEGIGIVTELILEALDDGQRLRRHLIKVVAHGFEKLLVKDFGLCLAVHFGNQVEVFGRFAARMPLATPSVRWGAVYALKPSTVVTIRQLY